MNTLRNIVFALIIVYSAGAAAAVNDDTYSRSVGNYNVLSPHDVIQAQSSSNREIEYMLKNYSLPELAKTAIQINKSQIEAAKRDGEVPPAKLTKEILSDKEKIADYLRSQYKFSY